MKFTSLSIMLVVLSIFMTGCSTTSEDSDPRDPLESINRPIWTFNWEYADKYVFKPVSEAYAEYVPSPVRTGVLNVALNLNEPFTAINNVLQGKFQRAGVATGRFVLNTTVGLFGWFDLAKHAGLMREEEEFGEVLGYYGVGDGPYLMLPVLGPSSVRDEVGDLVDGYYWPLAIIDFWPNVARRLIIALDARSKLAEQETLLEESLDPYEFVKNAYFQNIRYRLYDGNPPIEVDEEQEEELDDLLEEL
ncbi:MULTISPECIES: VacJ family lipoprotein [unclassified Thalassotalea]|uniref:MlaA family lipoprotein n=1 Tax=unclassified Thalassotalea TaxID=2614972 RepID=UPI0010803B39|nr:MULTISPECIES: VacJ family lipoprotein [unclassified Thalassotalea]NMP14817.1 VacJ family lipoprotein [Thalassotalea sp. Y01]QBY03384.1 VacJ family lipoprotein [Thalassotalea sp. HSM 43]